MPSTLQTMREGAGTQHPEEIINFLASRLITASGVFDVAGNQFLVEESDTPAMSVDVRQGYAFIAKTNLQMVYPVWLKTADAVVAITSNSSGNSRIDSIVLYIDLGASANPTISNVAKLVAVAGTPAGSPVAPDSTAIQAAIGASNPYLVLANVTVESGETTILDADISDQRIATTYTFATLTNLQNGWNLVTETWTRTGNHTFTVAGDLTTKYRKGAKVRYKDGGAYEYGTVINSVYSSPNTTVTLLANTNYAMAAATITDTYISYIENPEGFPEWFNLTAPTFTVGEIDNGAGGQPTTTEFRGRIDGKKFTGHIRCSGVKAQTSTYFPFAMGTLPTIANTSFPTPLGPALVSGPGFIPGSLIYYGGTTIYFMMASTINNDVAIDFGSTFSYEI